MTARLATWAELLFPERKARMCPHANAFVQAGGAGERVGVDVEVATTLSAQEERLEGVPQERLADAAAPIGTADTEEVDVPMRRILDGVLLRSEVAREFLSVPGQQPQLGIELGPVQQVMAEVSYVCSPTPQ